MALAHGAHTVWGGGGLDRGRKKRSKLMRQVGKILIIRGRLHEKLRGHSAEEAR